MHAVSIEGLSPDEWLALPDEEFRGLVFCGRPVTFRAGSAEVLGEFSLDGGALCIELAQIDDGGEGVLPTLWSLARRYARQEGLARIEWTVHAVHCARPNLRLRALLERKGFRVVEREGVGAVYSLVTSIE